MYCRKLFWLFWSLILLFIIPLNAQTSIVQIANKLPAETILVVHTSDRGEQSQALAQTPLGKLMAEPEMKSFVQPFEEMVSPFVQQADGLLSSQGIQTLSELWANLGGESFLAVTGIGPMGPSLVVSLKLPKEEKDEFYAMLERVIAMNVPIPYEPEEIEGSTFLMFPAPPPAGQIYFGLAGDQLVIGTDRQTIASLVKGSTENSLAQAPGFQAAFSDAPTFGSSVYANLSMLWNMPIIPQEAQGIISLLGINKWQSIGFAFGVKGEDIRSAFSVYAPDHGGQGILNQLLAGENSTSPHIKHVPSSTSFYAESTGNFLAKLAEFMPLLQNVVPGPAFDHYVNELGILDFVELIKEMETEWSYFQISPEGGSFFPNGIHLQKVKSKAAFEKKLAVVMTKWGFEKEVISYAGRDIHYWFNKLGTGERYQRAAQFDIDPKLVYLLYPYRSYFFVDDNTIAYSSLIHSMKNYAFQTSTKFDSLANNADFQRRFQSIGKHSVMTYRSKNENFAVGYRLILTFLQALEGVARDFGLPLEVALLPQAKTVAQYVTSDAMAYKTTANGFTLLCESGGVPSLKMISASSSSSGLVVVGAVGVIAAVAIPGLLRARISANESSAIGALRSLTTAQSQFQSMTMVDQDENGTGEYGDLDELAGTKNLRGQSYPASPGFISASLATMGNEHGVAFKSGYCFKIFLPEKVEDQENSFVAYAWPINYEQTGIRAFVVTQAGEVYACANYTQRYSDVYHMPKPNAAFSPESPDDGEIYAYEEALDGEFWSPLY